jgi:hypothetical protein
MTFLSVGIAVLLLPVFILAHPGHDIKQEASLRGKLLKGSKIDISHCAAKLKARGIDRQTIERRVEILRTEREKRGLPTGMTGDF